MFIAYLKQPGGCDYTIGCGYRLIKLHATTRDEAERELEETIATEYIDERRLVEVTVFKVDEEIEFNVESVYERIRFNAAQKIKKEQEEEEYEEYQRLKEKFES